MNKDLKEKAKELLAKDIKKTLEFLKLKIDKNSKEQENLTLIYGRFSEFNKQSIQGGFTGDQKEHLLNTLRQDILKLIDSIETEVKTDEQMGVFISHGPEDAPLALSVENFLSGATNGKVNVISNESLKNQLSEEEEGERELIHRTITRSKVLIIIITPGSNERPLLVWESGYAYGKAKKVIYLTFFVREQHIHPVFEIHKKEKYNGEVKEDMLTLAEKIVEMNNETVTDQLKNYWQFVFTEFEKEVEDEKEISFSKRLFHKHFHQSDQAEKLAGTWFAKWTQLDEKGGEDIFETDTLHVWSSENRLRVIGFNTKKNIDKVKAENTGYYPMEGVVSRNGWIALSYWSAGNIPICGTCLLKEVDLTGELLEGKWQGFTSKDIKQKPSYIFGRVVWSRNKEDLESYF